jgi:hypothetical protein
MVARRVIYKDTDITTLPGSLRLIFGSATGDKGEISIKTTQGLLDKPTSYPEAAKQQVTINGQPGVCVQGVLDEQSDWQADVDAGALEWSIDGFSYQISHTGLKLHCEDLLRIAGSTP